MNILNNNIIKVSDNLYVIKSVIKEEYCKDVDILKQWYRSDIAFKKDNLVYFCQTIEELEIIPEETEQKTIQYEEQIGTIERECDLETSGSA